MIYAGMTAEGVEYFTNVRARYDGERRNPWNEPECGHHYARAMSAWSGVLAMSGFRYHGGLREVVVAPRGRLGGFRCFWSTGTGWGTFGYDASGSALRIEVLHGTLPCRTLNARTRPRATPMGVSLDGRAVRAHVTSGRDRVEIVLDETVVVREGGMLAVG
jgi:hypothetical protein